MRVWDQISSLARKYQNNFIKLSSLGHELTHKSHGISISQFSAIIRVESDLYSNQREGKVRDRDEEICWNNIIHMWQLWQINWSVFSNNKSRIRLSLRNNQRELKVRNRSKYGFEEVKKYKKMFNKEQIFLGAVYEYLYY